jgi:itaconate CoA-transferase
VTNPRRLPLQGLLVIALEQAVAAPMCSRRLADAGARVIKLERPEGDFARGYDTVVDGQSSYFIWLNRGKESVCVDLTRPADRSLLDALLANADVFIQNLKPGATGRLGIGQEVLAQRHPRLIQCSISGYGEQGPYADRKAYDLLVQAESGLASVTGGPDEPARVGVSVVDICTGMNAYEAILEALITRGRTGSGADIRVSMFDSMVEWMAVPLMHGMAGRAPKRVGLSHPSVAPYGVFTSRDGVPILISIQNDREWVGFAANVLREPALGSASGFATNNARVANRTEVDRRVAACFEVHDITALMALLDAADVAYGRVNDVAAVLAHPHYRTVTVKAGASTAQMPAPPAQVRGCTVEFAAVPGLGAHTETVRGEFGGNRLP